MKVKFMGKAIEISEQDIKEASKETQALEGQAEQANSQYVGLYVDVASGDLHWETFVGDGGCLRFDNYPDVDAVFISDLHYPMNPSQIKETIYDALSKEEIGRKQIQENYFF